MSEETIKCEHCGKEPIFVKHCMMNCVYYNFTCSCKETPLVRSFSFAESEWENTYSKTPPDKMPKIKDIDGYYLFNANITIYE